MYRRPIYQKVIDRLKEPRSFMQVLGGPRQIGKTTLAHQIINDLPFPSHYASADASILRDFLWIEQQWKIGRQFAHQENNTFGALLVLDEIQKIPHWSDIVKKLWDEDTAHDVNLKVMLLGSSTLLIQTGLGESLGGRFELIPISHWSFGECREAFDWTLEQYIYFGGYPAAARLIKDEERWANYIIDSLIETSISRDILLMTRIYKPALLRRVFELGCHYTGRILSYQKMLGQLQDAGNASTLAHYLELLSGAGLVTGLQKFSLERFRQKASSPKLQVLNTALTTAQSHLSFKDMQLDQKIWEKLVECAIGAYLINSTVGKKIEIFYWNEGSKDVDFVIQKGETLLTLTINNFKKKALFQGMDVFSQRYNPKTRLLIGEHGIPVDEFLLTSIESWI